MDREYLLRVLDVSVKAMAAVLAGIYVCGFFTLSAYMSRHGVLDSGVLTMHYLAAGAPFVFFLLLYVLFGGRATLYGRVGLQRIESALRCAGTRPPWAAAVARTSIIVQVLYAHCVGVLIFAYLALSMRDLLGFLVVLSAPMVMSELLDATRWHSGLPRILAESAIKALGTIAFFLVAPSEVVVALTVFVFPSLYVFLVIRGYDHWPFDTDRFVWDVGCSIVGLFCLSTVFGGLVFADVDRRLGGGRPMVVELGVSNDMASVLDPETQGPPVRGQLLWSSATELYLNVGGGTVMIPRSAIRWVRFPANDDPSATSRQRDEASAAGAGPDG